MQNDLISRSKLQKSIQREEPVIIGGWAYIRKAAVLAKISMAPGEGAVNRGTAKNLHADAPSLFECSACHWECSDTVPGDSEYRFCPGCGKKIVGGADNG